MLQRLMPLIIMTTSIALIHAQDGFYIQHANGTITFSLTPLTGVQHNPERYATSCVPEQVTHLHLAGSDLTDDRLAELVARFPNVTMVDIGNNPQLTVTALTALINLKQLCTLFAQQFSDIHNTDGLAQAFLAMPALQQIDMRGSGINTADGSRAVLRTALSKKHINIMM